MSGTDRKLRAIYEAIDVHNFKAAIKLCSKKNLATNAVAQALKAHALASLGKRNQALQIAETVYSSAQVAQEKKTQAAQDVATVLTTLGLVFKNTAKEEQSFRCYEQASALCPDNWEYLLNFFFSHLNGGDPALEQMKVQAMRLAKNPAFNTQHNFLAWAGKFSPMKSTE